MLRARLIDPSPVASPSFKNARVLFAGEDVEDGSVIEFPVGWNPGGVIASAFDGGLWEPFKDFRDDDLVRTFFKAERGNDSSTRRNLAALVWMKA